MSKRLTIAIQKKGRLNQDSVDLITKSGISFSTNGERLLAKSSNFDIDILLVRDDDIPSLVEKKVADLGICLLYTSPSPRDNTGSRMPSSA